MQVVLNSYGLEAIVDVPTRPNSQTAVDQIIINRKLWDYNFKVIATGFSDHYAQILQIHVDNYGNHGKCKKNSDKQYQFKIVRSVKEEDIEYLNFLLGRESWNSVTNQTSVNSAYNEFISIFNCCHNIAMPKKLIKSKRRENSWVTVGIRVSSKRLRWLNSIIKKGNVTDKFKNYYSKYKKNAGKYINKCRRS